MARTVGKPFEAGREDGDPAIRPGKPSPTRRSPSDTAAIPTMVPPDTAWPVHVERFDARPMKRFNMWGMIASGLVTILTLGPGLTGVMMGFDDVRYVVFWTLTIIGGLAAMVLAMAIMGRLRIGKLPDDGLVVREQALIDAYRFCGLAEIRLATPVIVYDSEDEDYSLCRNGFEGLWFVPTDYVHSYVLYWRDKAYPDVGKVVSVKFDHDMPYGSQKPDDDDQQRHWRAVWRDDGVDLRMWPCLLQIDGERARLMFNPDAAKLACGTADPNIKEGQGDIHLLADTFTTGTRP